MNDKVRKEIQACIDQLKRLVKMKSHIYAVQLVQLRLQCLLQEEKENLTS